MEPFALEIPDSKLEDLRSRINAARWPEHQTTNDWSQGVPLAYLKTLCHYWVSEYRWRAFEARLNRFSQFITEIDSLDIHFLHVKSPEQHAKPLLLTHGWPGSVAEFLKVIEPLTDPVQFGGAGGDAFHIVCPSLPGYGLSGKPKAPGWGIEKIARAWNALMLRLGYQTYFAQGGDWGATITSEIGRQDLGACRGIHVNMPVARPPAQALTNPTAEDQAAIDGFNFYRNWDSGYSKLQATRPQTFGYGLADSPIAQAAWILEKYWSWTDCNGDPGNALTPDEMLDNISLYWLTNSAASSGRLYWESFTKQNLDDPISLPMGASIFPKEIIPLPKSWAQKRYQNIVYWNCLDAGGHFAALEKPATFVEEIRACFRNMQ
ncbi:MAG: epoxide hydrolase [Pseudomonadota bacterium]